MTEQKDAFEGVRAEYFFADGIEEHFLELKDLDGVKWRLRFSGGENAPEVLNGIARIVNAYPTLKSEMNSLADKIVELQEELENEVGERDDNAYVAREQADNNIRLQAEITRLKEELKKEKAKSEVFKKGQDNAHLLKTKVEEARKDDNYKNALEIEKLKEENERLKGEQEYFIDRSQEFEKKANTFESHLEDAVRDMNAENKRAEELNSQLSQAKERIMELETPDFIYDPEDGLELYKHGSGEMEERIEDYGSEWIGIVMKMHTLIKGPDKFAINDGSTIKIYDTEEQAQADIRGGECKICNGAGSIIDDYGAPLICECTVAGEPQQ